MSSDGGLVDSFILTVYSQVISRPRGDRIQKIQDMAVNCMHDTGITYRKGLYDKIKTKQFVTVSVIRPSGMSVSDNIGSPSI